MIIRNSHGLCFDFLENGSIRVIDADPIRISMKAATPFSRSGANLYLRKRDNPFELTALLGPGSNSHYKAAEDSFIAEGLWSGLEYRCILQLSPASLGWQWTVETRNVSAGAVEIDLVWVQDAGLKQISGGLVNEYYVSQYIERRILEDEKSGPVICCRQNMKEPTGNPWFMMACKTIAMAASVDGMQFYGKTFRSTGVPEGLSADRLGGEHAGESSVLALQEIPFKLGAGESHQSIFVAVYLPDHPLATSDDDLQRLPRLMAEFGGEVSAQPLQAIVAPVKNIFDSSVFLPVDDLNDEDLDRFFGKDRRHCETENGRILSFFCNENNHVVLHRKEMLANRPHAHIMQANAGYTPDESIISTATFAYGVFNSHLTQGNTNFNIFLSVCSSQFNLTPETGQRIFVESEGRRYLLGVPSAYEIGLNHCRWIYKSGSHCYQVRSWTSPESPRVHLDFRVISGSAVKLLITHHLDESNGWRISPGNIATEYVAKPKPGSMIAGKFPNARFRILINGDKSDYKACGGEALEGGPDVRTDSFFVLDVQETAGFSLGIIGEVCSPFDTPKVENADDQWLSDYKAGQSRWKDLSLDLRFEGNYQDVAAIQEILPWYGMNALTHFLTPYGPEQFSGAAWGTRDVAQGPFDLLLCMERYDQAREVLKIIFSNQDSNGGWPQWWMFDSYADIRADSSHGDIFYWCLIALADYIKVTGDLKILDEVLPYHRKGDDPAEKTPLSEHVGRLVQLIVDSFIRGTSLVPFGGGDWNDSLQPLNRKMAQRMISSWTVEMNYQAFAQIGEVYLKAGNVTKSKVLRQICEQIKADFNKHLVRDGVVAGYGLVEPDRSISLLLHPGDTLTNIQYSILPMNRGIISGIFTKEQADHHQELIEQHLKGPDGARLMNRPLKYKGGIQTLFQRAESSTFFGREIGIMYMHEHIRYAESLARTGKADAFLAALRQANPVDYRDIVPCGDIRQSNCYYSSSDVVFRNRYEADRRYEEIKTGKITLRGGWRVYSSGPGIYIGLVVSRLLGLRVESGKIIIDPVIPRSLDGLSASLVFKGFPVKFSFSVTDNCFGPKVISINGKQVAFTREENKFRQGGAVFPEDQFLNILNERDNEIRVQI